jgi:CDP-glycerol glycerophosphotransferase
MRHLERITKDRLSLRLFFDLFLNVILWVLSYVVPKDPHLLAFGSRKGEAFSGNPRTLFLRLSQEANLDVVWITKQHDVVRRLRQQRLNAVHLRTVRAFWTILRARALIIDVSSKDVSYEKMLYGRFTKLQTWHGAPIKRIELDHKTSNGVLGSIFLAAIRAELGSYDAILATSPNVARNLASAFGNDRVVVTGFPRNDVLVNVSKNSTSVLADLGIEGFERIYLYAPTYRDADPGFGSLSADTLDALSSELAGQNAALLLKLHHYLMTGDMSAKQYPNVFDVSREVEDIQDILVETDVLIADYSSVIIDFSLTGRPIIFFKPDLDSYTRSSRGLYYDYDTTMPGPFATDEDALLQRIHTIEEWAEGPEYRARYQEFVHRFHTFDDGMATERAIGLLGRLTQSSSLTDRSPK